MPCDAPTPLDTLERRYDGTPPRDVLRTARLGGVERHAALAHAAARALHARLIAEARLGAVRRRASLPASAARGDAWLTRLTATLAHHRHAASTLAHEAP